MRMKVSTLLSPGGPLGRENGMHFVQPGTAGRNGSGCRADLGYRDSSNLRLGNVPGRHPVAQPSGCLAGSHDTHWFP